MRPRHLLVLVAAFLLFAPSQVSAWVDPPFITMWGTVGSGPGQILEPTALATDPSGTVYVSDGHGNRVIAFAGDGTFLREWPTQNGEAWYIACGPDGTIYTAESFFHAPISIRRYSPTGVLLSQWGGAGGGPGQFRVIGGLAVDRSGTVYVSDGEVDLTVRADYTRIQVFSADGTFLNSWEVHGTGTFNPLRWHYGPLTVDAEGNLYALVGILTPTQSNSLWKLSPTGTIVDSTAIPQEFAPLRHITADAAGDVALTCSGSSRVVVFSSSGALLGAWGTFGHGPGQFEEPFGIAFDRLGDIYVSDIGHGSFPHIQKFGTSATPAKRTSWARVKARYR